MAREIIIPKDEAHWLELRRDDLTSTDIAALFGISPYLTLFELWHRKKDKTIVDFQENDRMKWGNLLEKAIAEGIAEEQGWTVRPMKEYIRGTDLKIGSSFDYCIEGYIGMPIDVRPGSDNRINFPGSVNMVTGEMVMSPAILEIKNVDGLVFKQQWLEDKDGNLEAPLHIEIQIQHQLLVSGYEYAYIGALVGGNNLILLKRERNMKVINSIKEKVQSFWKSIEENNPPEPNFETDSSFINSLYGYAEPGKYVDATDNTEIFELATRYKEVSEIGKVSEIEKKALKAQILTIVGDAEKIVGEGFSISAGMTAPAYIEAYERKGFRAMRIYWKKGAK